VLREAEIQIDKNSEQKGKEWGTTERALVESARFRQKFREDEEWSEKEPETENQER
jgi:hypothetical protein